MITLLLLPMETVLLIMNRIVNCNGGGDVAGVGASGIVDGHNANDAGNAGQHHERQR